MARNVRGGSLRIVALLLMVVVIPLAVSNCGGGGGLATTYTITYNSNGSTSGTVPVDGTSYTRGQTVTVLGNSGGLAKTGYFPFVSWNTQADGKGTNYTTGQTFKMGSANLTLYARWGTIPDTGLVSGYTTTFGEDNDYTINPPSYTNNGDGTVTDNVTGLLWQKCTSGQDPLDCSGSATSYNWYQATGTADGNYNPSGSTNVCGDLGAGWRLPTMFEMTTLWNYGKFDPVLDPLFVQSGLNGFDYWTATEEAANSSTNAWFVYGYDGLSVSTQKSGGYNVRCVRGSERIGLYTDGTGTAAGTVTDETTGLVWQKCNNGQTNNTTCDGTATALAWDAALSYCEGLSLGGYDDWRLPNVKELHSIVDTSTFDRSLGPLFPNAPSTGNWTSTASPGTNGAWIILQNFDYGGIQHTAPSNLYYVRCVRGQ